MGRHDHRPFTDRLERAAVGLVKRVRQRLRPADGRTCVFVAGMQRSGTNMVMEVLERSLDTDVFHETDPRAFENYGLRENAVLSRLIMNSRARCVVVKILCDLDRTKALMDSFSPAKTLWIVRRYQDTVASAIASFSGFAARMGLVREDRLAAGWYGRGMSDATHALLCDMYHEGMSEASAAAMMWYWRNVLFFEQALDRDPRVLLVSYERLVERPREEFLRIFRFLGLEFDPRVSRRVRPRPPKAREDLAIEPRIAALCEQLTQQFERLLQDRGAEKA